jgi:hypothetical protein
MNVPLRQLQYWSSAQQQWLTAAGSRTLYVGTADSLSALPLQATVTIPSSSNVTCENQQLSAVMVQGTVTVPHGAWCDLIDTSVAGNLQVNGSGIRIAGSTIKGNLDIGNVRDAADPLSSGTNVVCNTTVDGNVALQGSSHSAPWNLGLCGANTIKGNVTFNANAASGNSLTGNTIGGNLVCLNNGSVAASGNKVKGRDEGQCAQ